MALGRLLPIYPPEPSQSNYIARISYRAWRLCPMFPDSPFEASVRCDPRGHGSSAGEGRQDFDYAAVVEHDRLSRRTASRRGVHQER